MLVKSAHGGFDGGAVAKDGTVEKDLNLKISLQLEAFLKTAHYNVIMTRKSDGATDSIEDKIIHKRKKSDLQNRLSLINNTDNSICVSIHLNKFTATAANGMQVFYSPNNPNSKKLADCIQKFTRNNLQPNNERVTKMANKSTYLLYNAQNPAVIVECGFISNPYELNKLKDSKYQKNIAYCIFCGILQYYSKYER